MLRHLLLQVLRGSQQARTFGVGQQQEEFLAAEAEQSVFLAR